MLEFLLADAIRLGCRHVITCGSIQSNQCRTVAVLCAQLGLKAHLILMAESQEDGTIDNVGNVILDRLCGAELYLVPHNSTYCEHLKPRMEALAEAIQKSHGEKCYLVPFRASNNVGLWGYLNAFHELTQQNVADDFDDIVIACCSGRTLTGLAIGNALSNSGLKIHGITLCRDAQKLGSSMYETLGTLGLTSLYSDDILHVIEGYQGLAYNISQQDELDFIADVAKTTGIILDPTYTGKAAYGLVQELNQNPERFKGKRILFIHTGGLFGIFDGKLQNWLSADPQSHTQLHTWHGIMDPVPSPAPDPHLKQ